MCGWQLLHFGLGPAIHRHLRLSYLVFRTTSPLSPSTFKRRLLIQLTWCDSGGLVVKHWSTWEKLNHFPTLNCPDVFILLFQIVYSGWLWWTLVEMTTCLFDVSMGLSARNLYLGRLPLGLECCFQTINDRKEKYFQKLGISKCSLIFILCSNRFWESNSIIRTKWPWREWPKLEAAHACQHFWNIKHLEITLRDGSFRDLLIV